ncbi:Rieske 2Fe-2S domain-containing protein [Geodermatophilus sp. FMUSA9-8]|uniref:Rieske 2Fe-2S domain-containing protein n=1 Tax=Geodermatophilus sp. FMUSA9-8 TaxID=3120155 RepID=UPI00300A8C2B
MTATRMPSTARTAGWFPVARAAEVGTTPVPVGAGGRSWVVVRLRPGAEVSAFPARCPHRLVPLAAATVVEGRLQCPYHGWRFDGDGRCVDVPSLGPDGAAPPRADLAVPWAVEERHGWVWLAPERTAVGLPPAPSAAPVPEPAPAPAPPAGPVLGNLHPALEHAWHPVALSRELRPGGWLQVRLLGRTWTLSRTAAGVTADPPAWGVRERLGVVWLAPAEPRGADLVVPEDGDRRFVRGWLPPARSAGPAATLADALLDVAHLPFVHADGGDPEVAGGTVTAEPGGFTVERSAGGQRVTAVFRVPFLLRQRTDLGDGAARTLLVLLQPEDADSTRVHACVLLAAPPGAPLPGPDDVAAAVAAEARALDEDLDLQAQLESPGLPLDLRAELHVRADAAGVALRRTLADLAAGR